MSRPQTQSPQANVRCRPPLGLQKCGAARPIWFQTPRPQGQVSESRPKAVAGKVVEKGEGVEGQTAGSRCTSVQKAAVNAGSQTVSSWHFYNCVQSPQLCAKFLVACHRTRFNYGIVEIFCEIMHKNVDLNSVSIPQEIYHVSKCSKLLFNSSYMHSFLD